MHCIPVNLRHSQGNSRTSGIQMVTTLTERSNPSRIPYFLTAATKLIRYVRRTRYARGARISRLRAITDHFESRVGSYMARGESEGTPRAILE